jgi:23S rRNA (guanosine2251-2'-O)-methyltransferase
MEKKEEINDIIYGIHPVLEAIKSGKEIEKVFLRTAISGPNIDLIRRECKQRGVNVQEVPLEKLNKLTRNNHQGVVAFGALVSYQDIEYVIPALFDAGAAPFILILDRVTDVRNFGAICRTAECAGVDAVLFPVKGSAQINADAVRSSAGAIHNIILSRSHNLKNSINYLKISGIKVVACTEKSSLNIFDADLSKPIAILLGSEENGISPEYLKLCDEKVYIPMKGEVSSLNVGAAGAVAMFEVLRKNL